MHNATLKKKCEYRTVEGHPVEVGKRYVTRSGEELYVCFLDDLTSTDYPVAAYERGNKSAGRRWFCSRGYSISGDSDRDLMRPAKLPRMRTLKKPTTPAGGTSLAKLRDKFALAAMAAIIAKHPPEDRPVGYSSTETAVAIGAYGYADAMLAAREGK